MIEPISTVQWLPWQALTANDYNPNMVHKPELRLLELSIVKNGWLQPVLAEKDLNIIDGFHRWSLVQHSELIKTKYAGTEFEGKLPVVVFELSRPEAMLLTIRINRAKGTHVALQMSEVVSQLIDNHHYDPQEIAQQIGGTVQEVNLLYSEGVFKSRNLKDCPFSPSWIPKEEV